MKLNNREVKERELSTSLLTNIKFIDRHYWQDYKDRVQLSVSTNLRKIIQDLRK
jgi:hypothetical protein